MATTTDKIAYAAAGVPVSITFTAPANSATAGQCCLAIDNTANLFTTALLTLTITTSATAAANDKGGYLWLYQSVDGTNFNISTNEMATPGTNAACTPDASTNMTYIGFVNTGVASKVFTYVLNVAAALGGDMPQKWGFVYRNYTGSTPTSIVATYVGVNYTNS